MIMGHADERAVRAALGTAALAASAARVLEIRECLEAGELPGMTEQIRVPKSRLSRFRESHPEVNVTGGGERWDASYRSADGAMVYRTRFDVDVLLDVLEEELG